MQAAEHRVTTPDGRTLAVHDTGDPDGAFVFAMHGTPGCGEVLPAVSESARELGLRLLAHDRPGYGGSTRQPGRTIADVAADVAAIADEFGADRFGVWGASGGGPHALACAALLSDRVVGAAAIASPAPYGAEGLDYFAGMGELNVMEVDIIAEGPERHIAWLQEEADGMLSGSPQALREGLSTLLSPVDAAALTDELAAFLHDSFVCAVANGVEGWHDESVADLGDWGFRVDAVGVPVQVWHGGEDRFVPGAHGRWLAAHIPGAELHFHPELGHISLIERCVPEVQAWLAARLA
ncbi:MAG TPA: alpha/beta hydrolase [Gaiellales bacterium]